MFRIRTDRGSTSGLICFLLLLCNCVCWAAGDDTESDDKLRVLWIDTLSECATESVFSSIIVEVDELPVDFRHTSLAISMASTNIDELDEILSLKQADAALWFSCNTSELNVFSKLLKTTTQTKTVAGDSNGDASIEAATAIVRNWLEGLLPLWDKARYDPRPGAASSLVSNSAEPENTRADSTKSGTKENEGKPDTADDAFADRDDSGISETAVLQSTDRSALENPERNVFVGAGFVLSSPGNGRLIPGGYGLIGARIGNHFEVGISGAVVKTINIRNSGVETALNQYPLSTFVSAVSIYDKVVFEAQLGVELTPMKRKVFVNSELFSNVWKRQASCMVLVGAGVSMGDRFKWLLQLGARVVLQKTVLQIEVGDSRVTVYDPWQVQPVMFTGLQVGIY